MTVEVLGRVMPGWMKRRMRLVARWAAGVRTTRVWPLLRPVYRLAHQVVDLDRVIGHPRSAANQWAHERIHGLRRRLLSLGLTAPALRDLRRFATDPGNAVLRRLCAWELALWYANQDSPEAATRALRWLATAAEGEVDPVRRGRIAVVAAECHETLGDHQAAEGALSRVRNGRRDANLLLAHANLARDAPQRLTYINRALAAHRVSPIQARITDQLAIDALQGPAGRAGRLSGPCVSVIIPAYNAELTVQTALRSVLAQTWQDIEVLVVDDASTDATASIVEEVAATDRRVRLLQAQSNQGPYAARNLALQEATGEFVTCHDADDWSHPEKIERQVTHLWRHPHVIGNTSQQARATTDLRFHRRGQPGRYVFRNLSSFMFRRHQIVERLGCWDSVRFGGDEELVQRAIAEFGPAAVVDLPTGPLCFQRQRAGSLTADEHYGYHGFLMGARLDYEESYRHHHRTAGSLRYRYPQVARPFAVPAPLLPRQTAERRHFDVIIASDFRLLGGSTMSSLEEVHAQRAAGLRTGLVQLSRFEVDPTRTVLPRVRDMLDGDTLQMIVHGEQVSCDLLIIRYPPVLQDWQRYVPDVQAGDIRVIINQPPMSDYGPEAELRYDISRCAKHIRRRFGKDARWHPIGPLVRQALYEHHAEELSAITLADDDWVNIIDVAAWRRAARPERGARPRIGRHSRDHIHKWPATADDLRAAYPDASNYEVHILGGADVPRQLLGYWPESWQSWRFGELHPRDFLSTLDVFVYFTHPYWVESFGRVILEAMAAGVPVVLPHSYRHLYGDAAIYAGPADVPALVDKLMADDEWYETQVQQAQQYVEGHFGYSRHLLRLRSLTGRGGPS